MHLVLYVILAFTTLHLPIVVAQVPLNCEDLSVKRFIQVQDNLSYIDSLKAEYNRKTYVDEILIIVKNPYQYITSVKLNGDELQFREIGNGKSSLVLPFGQCGLSKLYFTIKGMEQPICALVEDNTRYPLWVFRIDDLNCNLQVQMMAYLPLGE